MLGDKRQLEREDWTYTTMALCGAWAVTQPTPEPMSTVWKEKMPALAQRFLSPKVFSGIGGMGVGSLLGPVAYIVWKNGTQAGRVEEEP